MAARTTDITTTITNVMTPRLQLPDTYRSVEAVRAGSRRVGLGSFLRRRAHVVHGWNIQRLWPGVAAFMLVAGAVAADGRSQAIEALCQRLAIGPGAVVADVGCGEGLDAVVFARVVGDHGTVLAQEIEAAKLSTVVRVADKHGFRQIIPVLGQTDDPRLPDNYVDLIYMNRVFHHFARPHAMLQQLARDLKPGGLLVIVDQERGPLKDWAPMEVRETEHHWTGETTVARLALEAGFQFHDALEDVWHESRPFVLAFRKPAESHVSSGDVQSPPALVPPRLLDAMPLAEVAGDIVFCGLDQGRAVAPDLRSRLPSGIRCYDLILEEWAVSRDELPTEAPPATADVLRTERGRLSLPEGTRFGAVVFADSYHRLWDPGPILRQLRERMAPAGWIMVVDREGPEAESRRLAAHRRRMAPQQVIADLGDAGYHLHRRLPAPTVGRYSLLFMATPAGNGESPAEPPAPTP